MKNAKLDIYYQKSKKSKWKLLLLCLATLFFTCVQKTAVKEVRAEKKGSDFMAKEEPDSIYYYLMQLGQETNLDLNAILKGLHYLHQKQKFSEALSIIDIVNKKVPTVEMLSLKAAIFVNMNRATEAVDIYNKLIEKHDTIVNLRIGRAIALADLKKYTEAISDLDYIIQRNPKNTEYLNFRAELKFHINDLKGSFADYKKSSVLGDSIAFINIDGYQKKYPESKKW